MKVHIRVGQVQDSKFIKDAQIAMAFETEGGMQLDGPTVEKGVAAVFGKPSLGEYYIAEASGGELLGCLLTVPEWSDWRNGTVLWIHSVYVVPEARKRGVYRALYAHLKSKVETSKDLRGLRLYVERKNEIAQATYQNLGMTKEHYELYEWLKA